jgi:hypothetical protein
MIQLYISEISKFMFLLVEKCKTTSYLVDYSFNKPINSCIYIYIYIIFKME